MKNIVIALLFLAPFSAFAAASITITPSPVDISGDFSIPTTFRVSVNTTGAADDVINGLGCDQPGTPTHWAIQVNNSPAFSVPIYQKNAQSVFTLGNNETVRAGVFCYDNIGYYSSNNPDLDSIYLYNPLYTNDTLENYSMFASVGVLGSSTTTAGADLAAAVKNTTDGGFPFVILILGLTFGFYALEAMFALFPNKNRADNEK